MFLNERKKVSRGQVSSTNVKQTKFQNKENDKSKSTIFFLGVGYFKKTAKLSLAHLLKLPSSLGMCYFLLYLSYQ